LQGIKNGFFTLQLIFKRTDLLLTHLKLHLVLLCTFAKFQKANVRFVISVYLPFCLAVRPTVCPHAPKRPQMDLFSGKFHLIISGKPVENIQVLFKSNKNNKHFK
jgi:hypothetical protein